MCESDWVREGFVEDLIVESIEESIFFCSIEITTKKKIHWKLRIRIILLIIKGRGKEKKKNKDKNLY